MSTALLKVRVARKWNEADGIAGFELVAVDSTALPAFTAGSHIDVHLPNGLVRSYSLCNSPAESHRYQLGVLREPASRGGSLSMHDEVAAGDVLSISAPRNCFALASPAQSHVLLAGGIGITPLIAMAEQLLLDGAAFELHLASRTQARTPFAQRIGQSALRAFTQFHVDDGPAEQRLDFANLLARPQPGRHLYVCGPQGFIEAALGTARKLGWPDDHLHCEHFGASAVPVAGDAAFDVHLRKAQKVVRVAANQSIVQALNAAGVFVPTSCEQGICGTCLTSVVEGHCDHRDQYLTPEEQAANNQMLPCVSRARGAQLVLDI
jgi:vanillate monooxygenase ferredoxin subunit